MYMKMAILAEAHAMLRSLREGRISQIILALESRFTGCNTSFCCVSYNIARDPLGREEQIYASARPDRLLPKEYNLASAAGDTETTAAILPGVADRLIRNIGDYPRTAENRERLRESLLPVLQDRRVQ